MLKIHNANNSLIYIKVNDLKYVFANKLMGEVNVA